MTGFRKSPIPFAILVASFCSAPVARAADAPADLCSLLSASDVKKAVGKSYEAPRLIGDPRFSAGADTDCNFTPKNVGEPLLFRVYTDNSPETATDLFDKLQPFHSPATPVSGIGDEAYLDAKHSIHVRKGKLRFYLNVGEDAKDDEPVKKLAAAVAGKL
jgi:hypothetical protein